MININFVDYSSFDYYIKRMNIKELQQRALKEHDIKIDFNEEIIDKIRKEDLSSYNLNNFLNNPIDSLLELEKRDERIIFLISRLENNPITLLSNFFKENNKEYLIVSNLNLLFAKIKKNLSSPSKKNKIILTANSLLFDKKYLNIFINFLITGFFSYFDEKNKIIEEIKLEEMPFIYIVGNENEFDTLHDSYGNFTSLVSSFIEIPSMVAVNKESLSFMIKTILDFSKNLNLSSLAIYHLLRYSNYLCESNLHFSTDFNPIKKVIKSLNKSKEIIKDIDILDILEKEYNRVSLYQRQIFEEVKNKTVLIELDGRRIGKVNALSVVDKGSFTFYTPALISASVSAGTEGIVNIEHEVGLSGEIHNKGLLILESYLRNTYAKNFPLSLYSGICFEQSYAEVDGDSASSSELFALLSAISDIPIKQNIAVTGSVNQMGEIQPVGAINEKVEGYYRLCKSLDLKNKPGVIIPIQNVQNLILKPEILKAIENEEFFIYPINNINQGLEILSDRFIGQKNKKNLYEVGSINKDIEEALKRLHSKAKTNS